MHAIQVRDLHHRIPDSEEAGLLKRMEEKGVQLQLR